MRGTQVFTLRQVVPADEPFLWDMLYEAVHTSPGEPRPPREIVLQPELAHYVRNWGLPSDMGVIAVHPDDQRPVGAAWLRLLQGENAGYGYVDDATPEISLAVLPEYRGLGLGTRLMQALLDDASRRYSAVSLSVDPTNPALHLYQRLGFEEMNVRGTSLVMIRTLTCANARDEEIPFMLPDTPHTRLARLLADDFSRFPQVEAVALAGSLGAQTSDTTSDIDLYIYVNAPIPVSERAALVQRYGASRADLDLNFWDPGDEWIHAESGIEVDVMFWDPRWIEDQLDRVLIRCEASMGYTTCFWNTLRNSAVLFDRQGWFAGLKTRADQPYPEALRRAVIAKNHPVLRRVIPGYAHQIEKAWRRGDWISVNHRVAALFASYFDVIFALNRVLHPGEKRLLTYAADHCALLPADIPSQVSDVLRAAAPGSSDLPERVRALLDNLDALLVSQGFDPQTSLPK